MTEVSGRSLIDATEKSDPLSVRPIKQVNYPLPTDATGPMKADPVLWAHALEVGNAFFHRATQFDRDPDQFGDELVKGEFAL